MITKEMIHNVTGSALVLVNLLHCLLFMPALFSDTLITLLHCYTKHHPYLSLSINGSHYLLNIKQRVNPKRRKKITH